jgi:hypothetical protein
MELRIADWLAPFLAAASISPGRLGGLRISGAAFYFSALRSSRFATECGGRNPIGNF